MSGKSGVFPSEWADDGVMDVLFSPFRGNRDVNPRSWDSKMKFWTGLIRRHCADKKVVSFNVRQLTEVFERNGKVPSCLKVVIDDLKRCGVIQSVSEFQSSAETSWVSWSVNTFVKKPVVWSYNSIVKSSLSWAYGMIAGKKSSDAYRPKSRAELLNDLPNEQFVILDLVQAAANAIYERHKDSVIYSVTDNVIAYAALQQNCRDICADDDSFHFAILELVRQKLCTVTVGSDKEQLIRMVVNKSDIATPLSENEERIYRLKATANKLELNISKITEEMEECRKTAKGLLQQGKKSAALKCLRRKKMLSESLAQKEKAIDKIHDLVDSIQQTESQKQIVDAFASGVKAFKSMTKGSDLTEDTVDETMLNLQEVLEANEQISEALGQPVGRPVDFSDSDLENELDDILKARPDATPTRDKEYRLQEIDLDLPDVPEHEPNFSHVSDAKSKNMLSTPE